MWLGWFLALRAAWVFFRVLARTPGLDRVRTLRSLVATSLSAGVSLGIGAALVHHMTQSSDAAWHLPLVWWVMPFSGWLALGAIVFALVQAAQALGALTRAERRATFTRVGVSSALAALCIYLYKSDPENVIKPLMGSIPMDPLTAVALLLFAVAALATIAFLSQAARATRLARSTAAHLALIAGSILFGLPLLYLLITSFKEDRDMSSANGIIWVPRVQRTAPYLDPLNPLYESRYQGQTVQATVTRRTPGIWSMDIVKPQSLRGTAFDIAPDKLKEIPRDAPLVSYPIDGVQASGMVTEEFEDGRKTVLTLSPPAVKGRKATYLASDLEPIRDVGLRVQNYSEALSFLPPETVYGLAFLKNTLIIAVLSVIGTIFSSSLAAYAFARMRFPGRDTWFALFLGTMMLPAAVTMLPQFLIYRWLGWIDTLLPLWAPSFFGSALNIFMLRQFFRTIPMELEDAAKIDGCSYGRTFWSVMLPQIKPALAVIAIWTFMGAWNNFMGPLIYINSPQKMPISYALQIFMGDRASEPGLLMAFVTMTIIPVLLIFFFAQRYFIEGVTLSGLGGK